MRDFKGKTVLVTGGARGLGRAIGEAYAEAGAAVALVDIDGDAVSSTASALQKQGHRALGLEGDLAAPEVIDRVVGDTLRTLGELDVLVNNVAIADEGGVLDIEPDTWKRILDVNLSSYLFCSQAAARYWVERGRGGRIVNVGSIDAELPIPDRLGYCVTKAGVVALTRNLALALAPHKITVNCVNPGLVATGLMEPAMADPDWHAELLSWQPAGRMAEPRKIAEAVLYLSSDAADFVTGSTLTIDGGRLLQFKL